MDNDSDDIESAPIIGIAPSTSGLTVCNIVCKLKREKLTLSETSYIGAGILTLQLICGIGIVFMPGISITGFQYCALYGLIPLSILYCCIYANLFMGGWGNPDGKFWCDVKIMYVRGFNTLRTIISFINTPLYIIYLANIFGIGDWLTLFLLGFTMFLAEWQNDISENQNQYDVKAFDKFINQDDNSLCLETLHEHQQAQTGQRVWTPFMVYCAIKTIILTCVFVQWDHSDIDQTFGIPVAVLIVIYTFIVPLALNFLYMKNQFTFSQMELYRMTSDACLPFLIFIFTLV
jgi:hypothetical protein